MFWYPEDPSVSFQHFNSCWMQDGSRCVNLCNKWLWHSTSLVKQQMQHFAAQTFKSKVHLLNKCSRNVKELCCVPAVLVAFLWALGAKSALSFVYGWSYCLFVFCTLTVGLMLPLLFTAEITLLQWIIRCVHHFYFLRVLLELQKQSAWHPSIPSCQASDVTLPALRGQASSQVTDQNQTAALPPLPSRPPTELSPHKKDLIPRTA